MNCAPYLSQPCLILFTLHPRAPKKTKRRKLQNKKFEYFQERKNLNADNFMKLTISIWFNTPIELTPLHAITRTTLDECTDQNCVREKMSRVIDRWHNLRNSGQ
eukprot:c20535_g1_i5.p1 GENE.c20535_g1_i5~~c20535_g1_i5.p1  ORF type:complete len:104 (-),score=9.43 c20535_g1_i5:166-477(-)